MDASEILAPLNNAQREAVAAPPGAILALAGAGSGKTRVLVHRIAWLIEVEHVSPSAILAVTFTNKAAAEMRHRIEELVGPFSGGMWIGTFHGLAHRLLRSHWQEAGLPQSFQILDADDQYRFIRRLIVAMGLDEDKWAPKQQQWFINGKKDEGLRPKHLDDRGDPYVKTQIRIYQAYEEACQLAGVVDFAELLLRSHELWLNSPGVLQHYQQRFNHILVDEFQDTNAVQYAWLRLLTGNAGHLMVVGDDDQSIYGWRGAKIENIQRFSKDFPDTKTIRLEQNYRSTGTILAAANALISHNDGRLGKNLWTEGVAGEPISLYAALNEFEEAQFVAERIQAWIRQGNARQEVAILYRSNAQSRVLEEALIQADIAYRVYGGLRFFERAEIKDALAYLRLLANRDDDSAFERVINTPTRGVGDQTLVVLRDIAKSQQISLWRATQFVLQENSLSTRAANALTGFVKLIETLAEDNELSDLAELVENVIAGSGLLAHFRKEKGEKGRARIENLEELVSAARQFTLNEADGEVTVLSGFLSHAALEAGEGQADPYSDCVQLMTLHSAKGLEFPLVFLCGVEEGLFPHLMSQDDPDRLEEERRLCYVGITRAMQKLYITYAECRRVHGTENYHRPSRFIREIPKQLIEEVKLRSSMTRPSSYMGRLWEPTAKKSAIESQPEEISGGLHLGQRVLHAKFGEGIITGYEGKGSHMRIQVKFVREGVKWLMAEYAKLQPV